MPVHPDESRTMLSVVVCTYNRAERLHDCLFSLVEQTLDPAAFEVIVVDNNSTDNTQQVARAFVGPRENFRVVFEPVQGHSHARNCGWRNAKARFVAFIDDDCEADPHWCERILQAFQSADPPVDAVGGQILPRFESPPPFWFSSDLEVRRFGSSAGYLKQPYAKYGFSGANMAFPREVLEQINGFSLDFGIVDGRLRMGEDTDFFVRIRTVGRSRFWYDPEIQVSHWTPRDSFCLHRRLNRSFRCGRSHAYLSGRTFSLLEQSKLILSILLQLGMGLVSLLALSRKRAHHPVWHVQNAAHQLGLLWEGCLVGLSRKRR